MSGLRLMRLVGKALGLGAAAFLAWSFWPAALGGSARIVVVEGESMHPTFDLGELVLVTKNPHPHVGQIIAYRIPQGQPAAGMQIIHRIVEVRPDGSFVTKGDNRRSVDPFHVTTADVIGTPRYAVPHLGRMLGLLSAPWLVGACSGVMTTVAMWPGRRCNARSPSGHG